MLRSSLFLYDIMNVILGTIEKTLHLAFRNIVSIQFYYRYFYPGTKIERVILTLRKRVLSFIYSVSFHGYDYTNK